MAVRAIRAATTIDFDEPSEVRERTIQLVSTIFERNRLHRDDVISIFFTATRDVMSLPPAAGARAYGLTDVPLLCAQEMSTIGGLERCIRLLVHVETDLEKSDIRHVFLRGATTLRPDLAEPGDEQAEFPAKGDELGSDTPSGDGE